MAACEFCQHEEDDHCKGEVLHSDHKEDARMIAIKWRKNSVVCHTRHCEQPLCCCTEFLSRKFDGRESRAELEEFAELIARDDLRESRWKGSLYGNATTSIKSNSSNA